MVAHIKTMLSVTENGLDEIKQAQKANAQAIHDLQVALPGILTTNVTPLVEVIEDLTRAVQEVQSGRQEFPLARLDQVFRCMRTLNRVEDLTVDQAFDCDQNNKTLDSIREDANVDDCLDVLRASAALQEQVNRVHRAFDCKTPADEARERVERFREIQDLRRAIIAYIAS